MNFCTEGETSVRAYMAVIMTCSNKRKCLIKSEKWKHCQKKYSEVGQLELISFMELDHVKRKIRKNDPHFIKRAKERVISSGDIDAILKYGWVIERNVKMDQVFLVLLGYVGRNYRALHVVFQIISKTEWAVVMAYSPKSQPWKWSSNLEELIRFEVLHSLKYEKQPPKELDFKVLIAMSNEE